MAIKFMYLATHFNCIGYTINPEGLEAMITRAMKKRQRHILSKKNLTISIDPTLAKVFKDSSTISSK